MSRQTLLCFDLLVEVLDYLSISELKTINLANRKLWRACQYLPRWRSTVRPRLVQSIDFTIDTGMHIYYMDMVVKECERKSTTPSTVIHSTEESGTPFKRRQLIMKEPDKCHPLKQLRQSILPMCAPPDDLITEFGVIQVELPDHMRHVEVCRFLQCIAQRLADHVLVFDTKMTYAGCCKDTVPMHQLIDVFSKTGVRSMFLIIEPDRFEYCTGTFRSDALREWMANGPGLFTSPAVLRTPSVRLGIRAPAASLPTRYHLLQRPFAMFKRNSEISSAQNIPKEVKIFGPKLVTECLEWLQSPLILPHSRKRPFTRVLHFDAIPTKCAFSIANIEDIFIHAIIKRFKKAREGDGQSPTSWAVVFTVPWKKPRKQGVGVGVHPRPHPFRVLNTSTGECLSLYWHWTQSSQQGYRSFVLRRHPIYGPLEPVDLNVPSTYRKLGHSRLEEYDSPRKFVQAMRYEKITWYCMV